MDELRVVTGTRSVIVTHGTKKMENYLDKMIYQVSLSDPRRQIYIFVSKKATWNSKYTQIENVHLRQMSDIKHFTVPPSRVLWPSILLETLLHHKYAVFVHPIYRVADFDLEQLDASLFYEGHFFIRDSVSGRCTAGIQGYRNDSSAYTDHLLAAYHTQLTDPGNENFVHYYRETKSGIDFNTVPGVCTGFLETRPSKQDHNENYRVRAKILKMKRQSPTKSNFGILMGHVCMDKSFHDLTSSVKVAPIAKYDHFRFFAYMDTLNPRIIALSKTNRFPITITPHHTSEVWNYNLQASYASKDACEVICVLYLSYLVPPTESKGYLRTRDGVGAYLTPKAICVTSVHFEIFGFLFPPSFKNESMDVVMDWLYRVYSPWHVVYGFHQPKNTPDTDLLMGQVEIGRKKVKKYIATRE
jgi:hypothetical protein